MDTWQLENAKSHFNTMVKEAMVGRPQYITLKNKPNAVLLSISEYEKLAKPTHSFVEFLRKSPLIGLYLDFERDRSLPRDVDDL